MINEMMIRRPASVIVLIVCGLYVNVLLTFSVGFKTLDRKNRKTRLKLKCVGRGSWPSVDFFLKRFLSHHAVGGGAAVAKSPVLHVQQEVATTAPVYPCYDHPIICV